MNVRTDSSSQGNYRKVAQVSSTKSVASTAVSAPRQPRSILVTQARDKVEVRYAPREPGRPCPKSTAE